MSYFKRLARRVLGEKFKGYFDTGRNKRKGRTKFYTGEYSWRDRCKHYDQICERHGIPKQAMFTIAGQLLGKAKEGVFLESARNKKTNKPYDRAEDAKNKCEELNDRIGLPLMVYELGHKLPKYGSHFWEKTLTPVFDVRVIPMQEAIEPVEADDVSNIIRWRQTLWGSKYTPIWTKDEIIHYSWNITSASWPFGTSMLVGLETECETLEELEINANKYMEKQAYPYEVLQLGDGTFMPTPSEVSAVDSKWKNRDVGENIITTYPTQMHQGGTGGAPIRELSNILDFLKDNIIDTTMVPPISKQYNATQASAKEMMPWALANLIWPMQRMIKWKIENEVYKPYLEDLGFSVKTCPKLLFEPPDAHKEEDAVYYAALCPGEVIIPPKAAARELGYEEEYDEWEKVKAEREEAEAKHMQQQQKEGEGEEGKSYRVTELYKREKK